MGFSTLTAVVRGLRLVTVVCAAALLGVLPAASAQAPAPRFTYSDHFTTTTPGASAGRLFNVDFVNPEDPEGKPPAFSHVHLELPEGARFDTTAVPQCKASDPELMAQGAEACPADTRLGTNVVVVDTGGPGPTRLLTTDFVFLNNKDELIALGTERQSGGRLVFRAKIGERTFDLDFPLLPGTPPDGGADKSERAIFNAGSSVVEGATRNYLTTPPTCPADGNWQLKVTYTFRDGQTQSMTSATPCDKAGEPPDVEVIKPKCVRYVSAVGARSIAGVTLGTPRAQVLQALGTPVDLNDQRLVFCVGRNAATAQRLTIGFGEDGNANLIATTGRHHKTRDIGPGSSVRRFHLVFRKVRKRVAGAYVRRHGGGATLFAPRGSRLAFTAVTTPDLARNGKKLDAQLRAIGLR